MTLPSPYVIPGVIIAITDTKTKSIQNTPNERIREACEEFMGLKKGETLRKNRHRQLVECRYLYLYIIKRFKMVTLKETGRPFGFDHTTVSIGIRKAEHRLANDPEYAAQMAELIDSIITSKHRQDENSFQSNDVRAAQNDEV